MSHGRSNIGSLMVFATTLGRDPTFPWYLKSLSESRRTAMHTCRLVLRKSCQRTVFFFDDFLGRTPASEKRLRNVERLLRYKK